MRCVRGPPALSLILTYLPLALSAFFLALLCFCFLFLFFPQEVGLCCFIFSVDVVVDVVVVVVDVVVVVVVYRLKGSYMLVSTTWSSN